MHGRSGVVIHRLLRLLIDPGSQDIRIESRASSRQLASFLVMPAYLAFAAIVGTIETLMQSGTRYTTSQQSRVHLMGNSEGCSTLERPSLMSVATRPNSLYT